MCEALFPALLQHLATDGAVRDPSLPARLARQITQHVLLSQEKPQQQQARNLQSMQGPSVGAGQIVNGVALDAADSASADLWVSGDLRAVQIILRSLEHLRRLHLSVVLRRKSPMQSRAASTAAATPGVWETAVDSWEYAYGLEIDYLAVARVSERALGY